MRLKLKPIAEQVIVITGASSGIGLVTARMAARRGAAVVLASRNEADLAWATSSIRDEGGRAVYRVADVSDPDQVTQVAEEALRQFGRIDTWVNNAAVAVYGRLLDVPIPDMRRQFEVNYWGQVYGSFTAARYIAKQEGEQPHYGGALINVASALADRAIPLQGNYCAAKHALKALTETLRMEMEEAGLPISVTLVKPSSIDTPLFDKARTYTGLEPQPVPPVYAPEEVARAIMRAAERPIRDVIVGGSGKLLSVASRVPRLADAYMKRKLFRAQQTDRPVGNRPSNLHQVVPFDGGERGRNWQGRTKGSLYTRAALHPGRAAFIAAAAVSVVTSAIRWWRSDG